MSSVRSPRNRNLVQITNEWKAPGNSAVLGRNQYVALNLSAKSAKSKKPLSPYQKPCKHMSEAIVVDGTERGRTVKVCAEPNLPGTLRRPPRS